MAQFWENFVITGGGGCNCCGNNAPAFNCYMTLPPPIGATAYANLTVATDVLQNWSTDCFAFTEFLSGPGILTSFTSARANNTNANATLVGNPQGAPTAQGIVWVGMNVLSANTQLTVDMTAAGGINTESIRLYDSAGAESANNTAGGAMTVLAVSAGLYELKMSVTSNAGGFPATDTFTYDITANSNVDWCGLQANYDTGSGYDILVCT